MPPVPPLEPVLPVAPDEDPLEDGDRFVVEPPVPVLPELPLLGESLETLGIDPMPFPLLIVSAPVVLLPIGWSPKSTRGCRRKMPIQQ